MSANEAAPLNQAVLDAVTRSAEVLTDLPTPIMLEVISAEEQEDTGLKSKLLKTVLAQAAKTVATELKDDEAVAAKQKKEDPDEVAIESKDGEAMDVNQKEKDHEDKKSGTKGPAEITVAMDDAAVVKQKEQDAMDVAMERDDEENVAIKQKEEDNKDVAMEPKDEEVVNEEKADDKKAAIDAENVTDVCPLCLRSAATDAAEDADSTTAVCGEQDVENLEEEMRSQVEAGANGNAGGHEDATKDAEPVPTDDIEGPKEAESAPKVVMEYLIATDAMPLDFPAIEQTFGPKHTSTPKKNPEARPGTPMPSDVPQPDEGAASNDSWTDDEAFLKAIAEENDLVVFVKPVDIKVLENWKPTHDNFFAVLASGVQVHGCSDVCYRLETTAMIAERRNIAGVEEKLLQVVVSKAADRMMARDVAHPVPAEDFRAHLITKLGEDSNAVRIVATVHHASRATFVDQVLAKYYQAARQQNIDWHRVFTEGALHLYVDVSRSTNGYHMNHPLGRTANRQRIEMSASARRDLFRHGRALQAQWGFEVYKNYGVTADDGRKF